MTSEENLPWCAETSTQSEMRTSIEKTQFLHSQCLAHLLGRKTALASLISAIASEGFGPATLEIATTRREGAPEKDTVLSLKVILKDASGPTGRSMLNSPSGTKATMNNDKNFSPLGELGAGHSGNCELRSTHPKSQGEGAERGAGELATGRQQ